MTRIGGCGRDFIESDGVGSEIDSRTSDLAGASRGDKAAVVDDAKYLKFQRREAAKLGLDL